MSSNDRITAFIVSLGVLFFVDGIMLSCLKMVLSRANLAINLTKWVLCQSDRATADEFRTALSFGIIPWWACIGILMALYECPLAYAPLALIALHCSRIFEGLRHSHLEAKI